MRYLLKLPSKYTLSLDERLSKEERFLNEFKYILERYHEKDRTIDKNLVFNIMHDFNGKYIRLKVASPKLPKEMDNEIASMFSSVFSNTPYAIHCIECL